MAWAVDYNAKLQSSTVFHFQEGKAISSKGRIEHQKGWFVHMDSISLRNAASTLEMAEQPQ